MTSNLSTSHRRVDRFHSQILGDEKGATRAGFLIPVPEALARVGITRIERLITDNHLSYKRSGDMREAVAALGARVESLIVV